MALFDSLRQKLRLEPVPGADDHAQKVFLRQDTIAKAKLSLRLLDLPDAKARFALHLDAREASLVAAPLLQGIAAQLEERSGLLPRVDGLELQLERVCGESELDQTAERFLVAFEHAHAVLSCVEAGLAPFEALARHDPSLAKSAPPHAQQPTAPAAPPSQQDQAPLAPSAPSAAGGSLQRFALVCAGTQLSLRLETAANAEPFSSARIDALRARLRRRIGLQFSLSQDAALTLQAHSDTAELHCAQLDSELRRIEALLQLGISFDEALGGARDSDPQLRYDLRLFDQGYDPQRIHRIVALLLSVDVIQAAELCDNAPVTILVDSDADQAFSMLSVLRRAGARVALLSSATT